VSTDSPEQALTRRLKELRRKHFGPQGAAAFAQRLGLSVEEYLRFERGTVPPGELLVRICETTGEDLQWLLTGVAARGTVVISGTRGRHQDLLARLARLLDERPEFAAPLEAFTKLWAHGPAKPAASARALPVPRLDSLIPIFDLDELPPQLPGPGGDGPGRLDLATFETALDAAERRPTSWAEPALAYAADALHTAETLNLCGPDGRVRQFLNSPQIRDCFPDAFGVRLPDDAMQPMFVAGDAVLVAPDAEPKIGRPVLCRVADEPQVRCRIWLGYEDDVLSLGRVTDGEYERVPRERVLWSLEVLYRVTRAA
jgi:transcriptional regulator with XRE-family HTH domain